jgi:hypothetical protein
MCERERVKVQGSGSRNKRFKVPSMCERERVKG